MCRSKISGFFGFLFLSMFFVATMASTPLLAQAGTTVMVKMIDAVDSSKDQVNKQYRGSLTKAVDTGNGVTIPQGAVAVMTLMNSSNGSGWTMQLVSVTINGQPVAITSGPASVAATAQTNAGIALNSMNSALGRFGHHVNAPAAATSIATGQRVVLPQGTILSFVLTASPAVPAQPMTASAPAYSPTVPSASASMPPNAYYTLCRYQGQQSGHFIIYVTPIIQWNHGASDISAAFNRYMSANYDLSKILAGSGYCERVSNSADQQAYTMQQLEKQWADSKTVVTHINWTATPDEIAAVNAKLAGSAPAATTSSHPGGPYISCATSGGAGIDTYLTGIFQTTRPVRHLPNGGNLVDQSVLDDFYAYLKQKGYNFKPGSNYGCDVSPTEAAAKAAQHKRHYEGGGCSTCGKTVETGWTE